MHKLIVEVVDWIRDQYNQGTLLDDLAVNDFKFKVTGANFTGEISVDSVQSYVDTFDDIVDRLLLV